MFRYTGIFSHISIATGSYMAGSCPPTNPWYHVCWGDASNLLGPFGAKEGMVWFLINHDLFEGHRLPCSPRHGAPGMTTDTLSLMVCTCISFKGHKVNP